MGNRIGLTGGLGAGKSSAADVFRELDIPVIDADDVARRLVEPGTPALEELVAAFGDTILNVEGRLDRAALRARTFDDLAARQQVEAILHPRIRRELARWADGSLGPYCVLVIPLLIEKGFQGLVDRVLVIDAPPELQRARALSRPGWTVEQVEGILAAQCSREQRLAAADDVVVNDGDLETLRRRILELDAQYRRDMS